MHSLLGVPNTLGMRSLSTSPSFSAIPVPALVVRVGRRFVARAFHADGSHTDSIEMTRTGAARVVKALAGRVAS